MSCWNSIHNETQTEKISCSRAGDATKEDRKAGWIVQTETPDPFPVSKQFIRKSHGNSINLLGPQKHVRFNPDYHAKGLATKCIKPDHHRQDNTYANHRKETHQMFLFHVEPFRLNPYIQSFSFSIYLCEIILTDLPLHSSQAKEPPVQSVNGGRG